MEQKLYRMVGIIPSNTDWECHVLVRPSVPFKDLVSDLPWVNTVKVFPPSRDEKVRDYTVRFDPIDITAENQAKDRARELGRIIERWAEKQAQDSGEA